MKKTSVMLWTLEFLILWSGSVCKLRNFGSFGIEVSNNQIYLDNKTISIIMLFCWLVSIYAIYLLYWTNWFEAKNKLIF